MICPQCRTAVPEGAIICEHCNFILDTGFLGEDITNDAPREEATRIKAVASIEDGRTRIKAADKVARPLKIAPPKAPPKAELYGDDDDESTVGAKRKLNLDEVAAAPSAAGEALEDVVSQYKGLPRTERIAAMGAGILCLSLVFPWQNTVHDGEFTGLQTSAWPVSILAGIVLAIVFLRRHPLVRPLREYALLVSSGASMLALLLSLSFFKDATVMKITRGAGKIFEAKVSWPDFGLYMGLVGAGIMVFGAVASYLNRRTLPD